MTEDERCLILPESRERADGLIIVRGRYGISDEEARRQQCIRLMLDDGYLANTSEFTYRLTSKGEDALVECEDESKLKPVKRAWKKHRGKTMAGLAAVLTSLRSCG